MHNVIISYIPRGPPKHRKQALGLPKSSPCSFLRTKHAKYHVYPALTSRVGFQVPKRVIVYLYLNNGHDTQTFLRTQGDACVLTSKCCVVE